MADTDRELLELAAVAAGFRCYRTDERGWFQVKGDPMFSWELWNPLTDDGDALRLAVKLRIDIHAWLFTDFVVAKTHIGAGRGIPLYGDYTPPVNDHKEARGEDPCAATRRAIVRAAAEIGRQMRGQHE